MIFSWKQTYSLFSSTKWRVKHEDNSCRCKEKNM